MLFYCVKLLKTDFNWCKINTALTLENAILQVPWVILYIERDLSKLIIPLPNYSGHVNLFEKTLIGGFSFVNTRLSFDNEILLPNVENLYILEGLQLQS